jgi:site-specific DNA recombinase
MIKLAFWGRVSTQDRQDPQASRAWQYSRAQQLVAPRGGEIVAEYFDIDKSRSIPPDRRPQASLLLAELANPDRGWDAVVVGEPQRAFYGNQFGNTFPLFEHYDVPLWVPEVNGPIDPTNEAHDMIMSTFGSISKGERSRIKTRVRATMAAMAQTSNRHIGGRPPYGYRLADAGPHPNPAKAADGKRLHVLEIDPYAAEVVQRIFAEFLAGRGYFAIAEGLTADGILSPSAYDPARNRHRCGIAWTKTAVRAILLNPRYTGRQVWNKQRKREVLIDVHNVALGHETKLEWNSKDAWVWSEDIVNPQIIDEETFAAVQRVMAARGRGPARHKPHRARRPYVLRACLHCGICHRRMEGSWNNDEAYYRCRFPEEYALANRIQHPRNVYLREAVLLPRLDAWLSKYFASQRRAETIAAIAAVAGTEPAKDAVTALAEQTIAECERKLVRYRAVLEALDESVDPAVVAGWITEAQKQGDAARAQLQHRPRQEQMSEAAIVALVDGLVDQVEAIRSADPERKADLYAKLGLHLAYDPAKQEVRAEARLDPAPHGEMVGVRGGT